MVTFADLGLPKVLLDAVAAEGYSTPTPIQKEAIPHVLRGTDLVALAQTGTGKTAAFALPILERLAKVRGRRGIRTLILSPTRELAAQIQDGFVRYGKGTGVTSTVIFGGVGMEAQRQALARGVDVVVATPGRLLDLMGEGRVNLEKVEVFVLDEADRMLDMGFIHDVKRIMSKLPSERQTLLFSATMPDDIDELARKFMRSPVRVAVTPPSTTVERISQAVYFVDQSLKRDLIIHLLRKPGVERTLVFTRTKHGADRVVKVLEKANIASAAIHGNKSQSNRERALEGFKRGKIDVLVATDIAARGIDVDSVTHVIQMDLPEVPEQYVHRIGRTARAGASGIAWALCGADERALLRDIEREIRMKVPVVGDHPFVGQMPPEGSGGGDERPRSGGGGRGGRGGGGGGGGFGNRGGGGGGGRGGGGSRGGGGGGGGSRGGARSGDGARADTGGASSGGGGAGAGGGGGAGGGAPSRGVTWSFRPGGRRR
jgi:ATP-dependent RNA helicase RhlE